MRSAMKRLLAALCICLLSLNLLGATELRDPELAIPYARKAPAIDGRLEPDEWRHAAAVTMFGLYNKPGKPMFREQPVFYVMWDNKHVYVAMDSIESNTNTIVAKQSRPDMLGIIGDDCLELMLSPGDLAAQTDMDVSPSVDTVNGLLHGSNGNVLNVLVCNLLKPDTDSVRQISRIAQDNPQTGVVLMGGHCQETYLIDLLRAGVRSFIPLDVSPEDLLNAIHEASQGRRYLPHPIYDRMLETMLDKVTTRSRNADPALDPYDRLTSREREVIRLAVEGHTCRDIAERLCVSARTVETHRANAMHKLGLNSRIELLRYAVSRGILSVE